MSQLSWTVGDSFRDFLYKNSLEGKRIHLSNEPDLTPRQISQQLVYDGSIDIPDAFHRIHHGKPKGLWYGFGDAWIKYSMSEYVFGLHPYVYEITINPSSILFLHNRAEELEFEEEYGDMETTKPQKHISSKELIDREHPIIQKSAFFNGQDWSYYRPWIIKWEEVAKRYSGIEIDDPKKMGGRWTREWSVPSGCIWNPSAITSINLIKKV